MHQQTESQKKYYVEQMKIETKEQILYDSILMRFLEQTNLVYMIIDIAILVPQERLRNVWKILQDTFWGAGNFCVDWSVGYICISFCQN